MASRIRMIVLTLFIAVLLIAFYWAFHFYRYIHQTPLRIDSAGYLVMVPPGLPVNKIAETLATAGVMEHPQWFLWWMQVTGTRAQVKAGEYLIKPGTTPQGLIDLLVAGKVVQHAITIVEGWTFERLMQAVNEAPKLAHTLQGLSNQEIMAKLGRIGEHPEGQFFPETYYFPANTTDLAFLQRAYRIMQDKLNTAWENRDRTLSLKTPYEALILASIIEKESCVTEEYAEIAGVYIRRLSRNMPLQADPTVIYGLGRTYAGQLTLAHLRQPSSYNTYLNVGLPPTPIALPSQKALEAATRPKQGDTLFFVATGTDRRHVFSKTEEEHQKAVLRYRAVKAQIEKERSLAAQETAVIAQEEEMVDQKKQSQTIQTQTCANNTNNANNAGEQEVNSNEQEENSKVSSHHTAEAVTINSTDKVKNSKSKNTKGKKTKDKKTKNKKTEKQTNTKEAVEAKKVKKKNTKADPKKITSPGEKKDAKKGVKKKASSKPEKKGKNKATDKTSRLENYVYHL